MYNVNLERGPLQWQAIHTDKLCHVVSFERWLPTSQHQETTNQNMRLNMWCHTINTRFVFVGVLYFVIPLARSRRLFRLEQCYPCTISVAYGSNNEMQLCKRELFKELRASSPHLLYNFRSCLVFPRYNHCWTKNWLIKLSIHSCWPYSSWMLVVGQSIGYFFEGKFWW